MSRVVGALFVLSAMALSGCLGSESAGTLESIFGADVIKNKGISAKVLEGATDGAGAFSDSLQLMVEGPKLTAPTKTIPPTGGGGADYMLGLGDKAPMVTVRFKDAAKLAGYDAMWFVLPLGAITMPAEAKVKAGSGLDAEHPDHDHDAPMNMSAMPSKVPATEPYMAHIHGPGVWGVGASLMKGNEIAGITLVPLKVYVSAHFVADGVVFPLGSSDPVPTPDYDKMTDKYQFLATDGGEITVKSSYRGTPGPTSGFDVDIAVLSMDGECLSGNSGATAGSFPPSPMEMSNDQISKLELESTGLFGVAVGALPANCGNGGYSYVNHAAVPYSIDVKLEYKPSKAKK